MNRESASRSGTTFVIAEDMHAEIDGDFGTFDEALDELRLRVRGSFDEEPLLPPCTGRRECKRDYHVREYNNDDPTKLVSEVAVVMVTAEGVTWAPGFLPPA